MDKEARLTFLRSAKWKSFRKQLLEERGAMCCLCGQKFYGKGKKSLHIHHLDPRKYDNLDPDKFSILCKPCHKFLHRILRRSVSKCPLTNRGLWSLMLKAITPLSVDSISNSDDCFS